MEGMTWSWYERAEENETEWIERLAQSDQRPKFKEISDAASEVINTPGGRLVVTTYDPYTGDTYKDEIRVDNIDDSMIIGSAGQIQIFVLPDLTAGHFDTQGGTERMPDLVTAFDVKRGEEN